MHATATDDRMSLDDVVLLPTITALHKMMALIYPFRECGFPPKFGVESTDAEDPYEKIFSEGFSGGCSREVLLLADSLLIDR